MDAGFLNVVEIGQYFMTKDTAEFVQFAEPVTCRECVKSLTQSIMIFFVSS